MIGKTSHSLNNSSLNLNKKTIKRFIEKKKKLKWKEQTLARTLELGKQQKIRENLANL